MADPQTTHKHFEIVDEDGQIIEVIGATDEAEAIKKFCHPALLWSGYEASGWKCRRQGA